MVVLSAVGAKVWLFHVKSSRGALGSLCLNVIQEACYVQDLHFFAVMYRMELYDLRRVSGFAHFLFHSSIMTFALTTSPSTNYL